VNPEAQFRQIDELVKEHKRQLVILQGTNVQLPFTKEYGYTQLLQVEGEEHYIQLRRDELHNEHVPLPKRYAVAEHWLHMTELLMKEQSLQSPFIVEHGLHGEFAPMLTDPSAQFLTQRLFTRINPGKQLEH
jgi:hypothetical protein